MMASFLLLLFLGLPPVDMNKTAAPRWTYNVKCHHCSIKNTFSCPTLKECPYEIRRCLTLAVRLNSRELYVYKDCTDNCTFLYAQLQPPKTPKSLQRTNSFFVAFCCNGMTCNFGGPQNVERDLLPDEIFEEALPEGAVRLGESKLLVSLALVLIISILT